MNDNSIKTSIELIDKLLIDNNYEVKIDPPINLDINLHTRPVLQLSFFGKDQ